MEKSTIILIAVVSILLSNCKKSYNCECYNPGGVFKTYKIRDAKQKAEDKCADYSKEYQTIPWSETECRIQ